MTVTLALILVLYPSCCPSMLVAGKRSNCLPFFVVKGGKEGVDACPYPCKFFGFPYDPALKGANQLSSTL